MFQPISLVSNRIGPAFSVSGGAGEHKRIHGTALYKFLRPRRRFRRPLTSQVRKAQNCTPLTGCWHKGHGPHGSSFCLRLDLITAWRQAKQEPRTVALHAHYVFVVTANGQGNVTQILAALAGYLDFQGIGLPSWILPGIQTYPRADGFDAANMPRGIHRQLFHGQCRIRRKNAKSQHKHRSLFRHDASARGVRS